MIVELFLGDLSRGDKAIVDGLIGDTLELARLRDMGLSNGTVLRVIKFAPFGDSMEIKLRGSHLFLRRLTANCIRVRRPLRERRHAQD